LGKEPLLLVTFRKLMLTDSMAFVVSPKGTSFGARRVRIVVALIDPINQAA